MLFSSRKLAGKTLYITGASRGIGKAIALKAAKDGAKIVVAAKTADPHPKVTYAQTVKEIIDSFNSYFSFQLPGTIFTAAKESKLTLIFGKQYQFLIYLFIFNS